MSRFFLIVRVHALALASVFVIACGEARPLPAPSGVPARGFDPETRLLTTDARDQAVNAAIERARGTVPQLLQRLNDPPPGLTYVGVKVRLGDPNGEGEHIWLYDVTYADGEIAGKLTENAQLFPKFRAGDMVRVQPQEISDWMIVENGWACGGFTTRIIAEEMTAGTRATFLAELGISRLPSRDSVCDDGLRS